MTCSKDARYAASMCGTASMTCSCLTSLNVDNWLAAIWAVSVTEEPSAFMDQAEVEAMLWREKQKASVASLYLDFKPPYSTEVAAITYPAGSKMPSTFWWLKRLYKGAHHLFLRLHRPIFSWFRAMLSKSLTNWAYTWFVIWNQDQSMIGSICCPSSTQSSFEEQFSFWRVGPNPTISRENLDLYVSRFQEKAIGCCDPIDESLDECQLTWYARWVGWWKMPGEQMSYWKDFKAQLHQPSQFHDEATFEEEAYCCNYWEWPGIMALEPRGLFLSKNPRHTQSSHHFDWHEEIHNSIGVVG